MTTLKKIIGIAVLVLIVLGILGLLVVLGVAGLRTRSVVDSSCSSAPILINGSQVASIEALQVATGQSFTAAQLATLGITSCDGGLCTTTCAAVSS